MQLQTDFICGKHAVQAFLENSQNQVSIHKIFLDAGLKKDAQLRQIEQAARKLHIPVMTCPREKLEQMSGKDTRHQGVVAVLSCVKELAFDELMELLHTGAPGGADIGTGGRMSAYEAGSRRPVPSSSPLLVLLDGIEDPHNLGAIIRTAESSGASAVLIPRHRAAGLTSTVAKTSAGAVAHLPIVRVGNLVQSMEELKKAGFWMVGLDSEAKQNYWDLDLNCPLVVVIGSEGCGLSRLVKEHCDFLASIPMLGKTSSLNASVAAGIFLYEVVRQQKNVS